MNPGLFKSSTGEWETPQAFFDELDREFHFTLDPCATPENAKCETYFTKEVDGLAQCWSRYRVYMNPPYGRKIGDWVKYAREEAVACAELVVCLLPARTDTRWFHDYIYGRAEIRFIKGRLKFVGAVNSAPFPSMLAIYTNH